MVESDSAPAEKWREAYAKETDCSPRISFVNKWPPAREVTAPSRFSQSAGRASELQRFEIRASNRRPFFAARSSPRSEAPAEFFRAAEPVESQPAASGR